MYVDQHAHVLENASRKRRQGCVTPLCGMALTPFLYSAVYIINFLSLSFFKNLAAGGRKRTSVIPAPPFQRHPQMLGAVIEYLEFNHYTIAIHLIIAYIEVLAATSIFT